jgi:hypothetical protein
LKKAFKIETTIKMMRGETMKVEKVDFIEQNSKLDSRTTLKCPQCGFECFHPISVSIHRGNDKTIVSSESIVIKEEKNEKRGVTITIEYHCENGHHGEIIFQFYKGATYVTHEPKEPLTKWETLWRD